MEEKKLFLPIGRNLSYSFPNHPFSYERVEKTFEILESKKILERKNIIMEKIEILPEDILYFFHEKEHINFVKKMSEEGEGYLDFGDTPVYKGVFEDALAVVSASLIATEKVWKNEAECAFNIIGGLHHAFKNRSAGFCVFNDVCVVISYLLEKFKVKRILYVDIDAHHGDGVFYSFYSNPKVWIADIHQINIFPGTGFEWETGEGEAEGTKLNILVDAGAGDKELLKGMKKIVEFGEMAKPEIILMQVGADGIRGDPLTQLKYSLEGHLKAVKIIYQLAKNLCNGKFVAFGGGGYNINNVSNAWTNLIDFLSSQQSDGSP
ncbi:MAG: acetoin utilization protein AcuC [Candidatus Aenigmarchaeota archaeon]|nr:acetoin utilization protein AcuC [Candidatus Aenigmarchaeota archaeon]MDW8149626.1 acetoin utilization protein AcuC [Candidatus Aenigmarchaeota archaeon]